MTTDPAHAGDDPRQMLAGVRELARRVRRDQRATWFPLVVFAAITFAAIPVNRYGNFARTCATAPNPGPDGLPGRACLAYSTTDFVYWPIALMLAYAAIAAYYAYQGRARGVGTRVRPYVIAGIILAILLIGASSWEARFSPVNGADILGLRIQGQSWGIIYRLAGAACVIGLALLVLAWAERNRALLLLTLGYLAIVLVPIRFGWTISDKPWAFLPHLLVEGGVLLLGGIGFALAQRRARPPAL